MNARREQLASEAFVSLADTLVADYEVIDLLDRLSEICVELLAVRAAGLLLADRHGRLIPLAASEENAHLLELFQLQANEGPSLDCFHTGAPVSCPDLTADPRRWPRFAARAERLGFVSVHALPLRLRTATIGAMNLVHTRTGALPVDDLKLGQALANVATIGILQARAIRQGEVVAEQLRSAQAHRAEIEQATGVIAERAQIDTAEAHSRLRHHARATHKPLVDIARAVLTEQLEPTHLDELTHPWA